MKRILVFSSIIILSAFFITTTNASMNEETYLKARAALIVKHSHNDKTFDALHKAMESEDTLSAYSDQNNKHTLKRI